ISCSKPVLTQGRYVAHSGLNLLLLGTQELKWTELHRVVLQLCFVDDPLSQRQYNVSVIQGAIPGCLQSVTHGPRGRANSDPKSIVFILCPAKLPRGSADTSLTLVEQRNGKFQRGSH